MVFRHPQVLPSLVFRVSMEAIALSPSCHGDPGRCRKRARRKAMFPPCSHGDPAPETMTAADHIIAGQRPHHIDKHLCPEGDVNTQKKHPRLRAVFMRP